MSIFCHVELAAARRRMVQQGNPIQEGSWSQAAISAATVAADEATAPAAPQPDSSEDGAIYLASVKASQQELDGAGTRAAGAGRAAAAALGAELGAQSGGLDCARLRAATEAALAAAGLSQEVVGAPDTGDCGVNMPAEAVEQLQDVQRQPGQQQEPESLCKIGSWASSSAADTASSAGPGSQDGSFIIVGHEEGDSSDVTAVTEPCQSIVAPEDIEVSTEASFPAAGPPVGTANGDSPAAAALESLYDLD